MDRYLEVHRVMHDMRNDLFVWVEGINTRLSAGHFNYYFIHEVTPKILALGPYDLSKASFGPRARMLFDREVA